MTLLGRIRDRVENVFGHSQEGSGDSLFYFDEILPVEIAELNRRRKQRRKKLGGDAKDIKLITPETRPASVPDRPDTMSDETIGSRSSESHSGRRERYPDPSKLARKIGDNDDENGGDGDIAFRNGSSKTSESDRMRPQPVPCTANGLALSGGGIRSAAVSLGALQALNATGRFGVIDYLSTVSGGGYMGSCLSAYMAANSTSNPPFPFGADISDNGLVAHLRNYSNYLLPRGRSAVRNFGEAAAILLRGIVINGLIVTTFVVGFALLTYFVWNKGGLPNGTVSSSILWPFQVISAICLWLWQLAPSWAQGAVTALFAALVCWLTAWGIARSIAPKWTQSGDTGGSFLLTARWLLVALVVAAFIWIQAPLICWARTHIVEASRSWSWNDLNFGTATALLAALSSAVSAFSSALGHFLETTKRASNWSVIFQRLLVKTVILIASAIVPVLIWGAYLSLSAWLIFGETAAGLIPKTAILFFIGLGLSFCFSPNGYSLNRFYRDRLARAFFPTDEIKLSSLKNSLGPYHILNAALNLQGSTEANKRGRNADFFIFTPDFVGSDLTHFIPVKTPKLSKGHASTLVMEKVDPALDLGTAMAISGAAVSANMGSGTMRTLSPTLALFNIRLGYWLSNPRVIASKTAIGRRCQPAIRHLTSKFYLLKEMLNGLDETSSTIYLTDGGHIENLGIYELLKRGCQTIVVIDAEADPELAFPSMVALERYARIDLGVRIDLPWDAIGRDLFHIAGNGKVVDPQKVHCAVGRVRYADGIDGTIIYFKSSLTGDERNYVQDYQRRNPDFPHETTGDQFFGEEQFEMYRSLGFHMVHGFFSGEKPFAFDESFGDADAAYISVCNTLGSLSVPA